MKRSQLRVLHPFFLAIYPVIFLFSHNMVELSLFEQRSVLRIGVPAVCTLGLTWLLLFVVNLAYDDRQRAGIVVSMLLFLFFLYGHIHHAIVNNLGKDFVFAIGPLAVKDHIFYYGASLLIVLLVLYLLRNPQRHLAHLTQFLNVVSCVLVALAVGNILLHEFQRITLSKDRAPERIGVTSSGENAHTVLPDIYYIIVDEYAAAQTLREHYQYDNQAFLDYLTATGFYVASKSCSNYPFTTLSLPSTLNLEYVNYLQDRLDVDETLLHQMTKDNAVVRFLQSKGYKFIHFQTGYAPTERNQYADWDVACEAGLIQDRFVRLLIESTAVEPFFRRYASLSKRDKIACQLSTLTELSSIDAPIFVLAHIMAPHWPYVFGPHGEEVTEEDLRTLPERQLYLNQLIFISTQLQTTIDSILSTSTMPPIVLVQSDTGPWITSPIEKGYDTESIIGRMRILNASYLPEGGDALLYDTITPVNTFRVLFNYYFGADYPLLDDRSYYAEPWIVPYQFHDVTELVKYP